MPLKAERSNVLSVGQDLEFPSKLSQRRWRVAPDKDIQLRSPELMVALQSWQEPQPFLAVHSILEVVPNRLARPFAGQSEHAESRTKRHLETGNGQPGVIANAVQ